MTRINKVAILGAGTMGARIAAHFANAGVPSYLLDIVPADASATMRNKIAAAGLEPHLHRWWIDELGRVALLLVAAERAPAEALLPLAEDCYFHGEIREIVAHCRSGKRSAEAVDFLKKAGFRKIWNLKGGILAWSEEVDPSVPKY